MRRKRKIQPDMDMVDADIAQLTEEIRLLDGDAADAARALPPQVLREIARSLPSTKLQVIALLNVICVYDTRTLARRFNISEKSIGRIRLICLRALRRERDILWKKGEAETRA